MNAGGWAGKPQTTAKSFRSVFEGTVRPTYLDFNGDQQVNGSDADIAIAKIVAKVKFDYAPYDLDIIGPNDLVSGITGNDDSWQDKLWNDGVDGDVLVMVTGNADELNSAEPHLTKPGGRQPDGTILEPAHGTSPSCVDNGTPDSCVPNDKNGSDQIVWVFGANIAFFFTGYQADNYFKAEMFINEVARTISHEMGHSFGLEHIAADPGDDASTHDIMAAPFKLTLNGGSFDEEDYYHVFNFQNIEHPVVDRGVITAGRQNAHSFLSDEHVLGPSTKPWAAVLKPGQLTIMGDDYRNTLTVAQAGNMWTIHLQSYPNIYCSIFQPPCSVTPFFDVSTWADVSSPRLDSLNPFDQRLATIVVHGKGNSDSIVIGDSITASVAAYGDEGNDSITGGSGNDLLFGGGGNDSLYGKRGNDVLFGEGGLDDLYGGADSDTLDGGYDGYNDVLYGNEPNSPSDNIRDTFVFYLHRRWRNATDYDWVPAGEETLMDFQNGIDAVSLRYMAY
jgi:hypothetical protein